METALTKARLILASASPRRRELFAYFGIPFAVVPSSIPEEAEGDGISQVSTLARQKGADIHAKHPDYFVLSADTLVCLDDQVLGKPSDHFDARRILTQLSGRWHQVHTAVCLHMPEGLTIQRMETTNVKFRSIQQQELIRYAASEEPMDKAGAYAMQGTGSIFIERIEGSPSNVIGLPLCATGAILRQAGLYL